MPHYYLLMLIALSINKVTFDLVTNLLNAVIAFCFKVDLTEKLYVIINGSVGIYFPLNHEKTYENYRADFSEDSKKCGIEDYKKVLKHIRRLEKDEWFG